MVGRFGNAELENHLKEYCRIRVESDSHCFIWQLAQRYAVQKSELFLFAMSHVL